MQTFDDKQAAIDYAQRYQRAVFTGKKSDKFFVTATGVEEKSFRDLGYPHVYGKHGQRVQSSPEMCDHYNSGGGTMFHIIDRESPKFAGLRCLGCGFELTWKELSKLLRDCVKK
jgi:hypothetical protein